MSDYAIKGIYRDRLFNLEGQQIFDSGWKSNLIVNQCRVLLASFMHNNEQPKGIQYLQIGSGKPEWDNGQQPRIDPTITSLVNKLVDIPVANFIKYLNENDVEVDEPTSRIEITVTLGHDLPQTGSPPYSLREFGLFGQLNGTEYMIDYIRHPLIEKSSSVTLVRKVRLVF